LLPILLLQLLKASSADPSLRDVPDEILNQGEFWWSSPVGELRDATDRCNDMALVPCDYWHFTSIAETTKALVTRCTSDALVPCDYWAWKTIANASDVLSAHCSHALVPCDYWSFKSIAETTRALVVRCTSNALVPCDFWYWRDLPIEAIQAAPTEPPVRQNVTSRCTSPECIAADLKALELQLKHDYALSGEDFDSTFIWGDEIIEYCLWEARPPDERSATPPLLVAHYAPDQLRTICNGQAVAPPRRHPGSTVAPSRT
jgi:hypothetical protein